MTHSINWHGIFQDILDRHLQTMAGKPVLRQGREQSKYLRVDYYCEIDPRQSLPAAPGEILPFDHLRTYNLFEYKSIRETLSEGQFRAYAGRTLVLEHPGPGISRQGDMTLTLITTRKPIGLLAKKLYRFTEIHPWKYRSDWLGDTPIFILIQRETRGEKGGEPFAYLQVLEGNPSYQKEAWSFIFPQNLSNQRDLQDVMMKINKEAFMILTEEWKKEGELKGFEKGKKHGIEQSIEQVALNMLRIGCEDRLVLETTGMSPQHLQALKDRVG